MSDIFFSPGEVVTYFNSRAGQPRYDRYKCPIHAGEDYNLAVDINRGVWFCHSQCQKGGSIFGMEMDLIGTTDFKKAKRSVFEAVGRVFEPSVKYHEYTDENGEVLYRVKREDSTDSTKAKFRHEAWRDGRFDGSKGNMDGVRRVLYRLPSVVAAQTVYLVEGEKCADILIGKGLVATTHSGGAGNWRSELNESLRGKDIVFIPDADKPGIEHANAVKTHLKRFAGSLKIIQLPGMESNKEDVYDWLTFYGHTVSDLEAIAQSTASLQMYTQNLDVLEIFDAIPSGAVMVPPVNSKPEAITLEAHDHPNYVGEVILKSRKIMTTHGMIYEYSGTYWEMVEEAHLRNLAMIIDENVPNDKDTTSARRSEAVSYVQDKTYRKDVQWRNIGENEIPLADGVYDMESGLVRPHRAEDYLEAVIPHSITAGAKSPKWDAALVRYWEGDADYEVKKTALQEFMGYCLMQHARYKKALILNGNTDCGKSLVLTVIKLLVGESNCCSIKIEDMDDQRKLAPIMGKMLNTLGELKTRAVIADGGFKTLVGTMDPVAIEKKFEDPLMYTPIAKHIIATNNLPVVNDRSDATFNRMLLLKFNKTIPKAEQDADIFKAIEKEMPAVFMWALEGAKRLFRANGRFTVVPESDDLISRYKRTENSLMEFIDENCMPDHSDLGRIPIDDFLMRYCVHINEKITRNYLTRQLHSSNIVTDSVWISGLNRSKRSIIGYCWKR